MKNEHLIPKAITDKISKIEKEVETMQKPEDQELMDLAKLLDNDIESLELQGEDHLDFYDIPVWNIKEALIKAYNMGYEKGFKEGKHYMNEKRKFRKLGF